MTVPTLDVAIVFHSGSGHTARQAGAVADGVRDAGGRAHLFSVDDLDEAAWRALDEAEAIVFGTPTYMGSPSARFKAFAEETNARVWAAGMRWRGKVAAGFTNSGAVSGDKLNSLVDLAILAAQHGMIWVALDIYPGWSTTEGSADDLNRIGTWLGAAAQSHLDLGPDTAPPDADLRTAAHLGGRVADVARQLTLGRRHEAGNRHAEVEAR
jgi:NAD(P)H dehydrogenase (quinone)